MARTKKQEGDAIARLTDAGEDALRQLVDFPHRLVVRSRDDLRHQIDHIASRLRAIDPLVARIAELEERVNTLERKAARPAKRKAPRRRATPVAAAPSSPQPEPTATAPGKEQTADVPRPYGEAPSGSQAD